MTEEPTLLEEVRAKGVAMKGIYGSRHYGWTTDEEIVRELVEMNGLASSVEVLGPSEPTIYQIEITICTLCLAGAGGECHVPGCWFWMWDAPTPELAERIRSRAFIEIVAANPDAFAEDYRGFPERSK